jgi:hypothetical protein
VHFGSALLRIILVQRVDTKQIPVWSGANFVIRSSTKKRAASEKILPENFLYAVFVRKPQFSGLCP